MSENTVLYRVMGAGTDPVNVSNLLEKLTEIFAQEENPVHYTGPLATDRETQEVLVPVAPTYDIEQVEAQLTERITGAVPRTVSVVLQTSGSTTGRGHLVGLSATALRSSAQATEAVLGGKGRWVLSLPTQHIAGFQVLVRSVTAQVKPVIVNIERGFRPAALARGVERALEPADLPVYLSLVPTQLVNTLREAENDPAILQPLRQVSAILLGGAHISSALLANAHDAGLRIVTTYGMTETCGGCVYDGYPLAGVNVATVSDRIWISGTVLMAGYLDDPQSPDVIVNGQQRWLRTRDAGHMVGARLVVDGRLDDVLTTGGIKVQASAVEEILEQAEEIAEVCVVGVPDEKWGELVTAVFVPAEGADERELADLRMGNLRMLLSQAQPENSEHLREELNRAAQMLGGETGENAAATETAEVQRAVAEEKPEPELQLTPLEAAMAAMAAKIRGENVDVVQVARTGVYNPPADTETDISDDDTAELDEEPAATVETAISEPQKPRNLQMKLRSMVSASLGREHAPRAIILVDQLPMLASGKVDRNAVAQLAAQRVAGGMAWVR
ncbi:MAG: AMP-binding protein [Varibaculum sp.]|nr:AMP-binding protein [Varibaculum sp.]